MPVIPCPGVQAPENHTTMRHKAQQGEQEPRIATPAQFAVALLFLDGCAAAADCKPHELTQQATEESYWQQRHKFFHLPAYYHC